MNQNEKPFAFKLAQEKQNAEKTTKWQARDGVAVAGCSFAVRNGELDAYDRHRYLGNDAGGPC